MFFLLDLTMAEWKVLNDDQLNYIQLRNWEGENGGGGMGEGGRGMGKRERKMGNLRPG